MPRKSNPPVARVCDHCERLFWVQMSPSRLASGRGRFCTDRCRLAWWSVKPTGPAHPSWKGDGAKPSSGRLRAYFGYQVEGDCQACGRVPARERHHRDKNPLNNDPANVMFVCTRCHVRLDRGPYSTNPKSVRARLRYARKRGWV